ncbi:MAG TPA: XRE family transcriptional regulator [Thermoleophilaceae bacterium]|jgi:transcriptional regulator with XRE-family HTH domain
MATTNTVPSVGPRIKLLREGLNLSLRDLAERSGVSAQMLSQVERGETSPTIAVAERIAAGLELTLSQLLRLDEGDGVNVVRIAERRDGGVAAYGHRFEVLSPALPGQRLELSEHFLAPGGATGQRGDPPIHEAGSRETAVVTEGKLRLVCDGRPYDLGEGDCVTFDADLSHHFENPGDTDARFYAVVSAGLRRS